MLGATDDANLPYFAGREGELCRRNLIQEWEETAEASQGGVDAVKFQALQGKHKVNNYKNGIVHPRLFGQTDIVSFVHTTLCSLLLSNMLTTC